ncbi:MAG: helix-turn-helix transcriptional regulator [Acidiferrobacter sp.]
MRASRLLSILMALQARGAATAPALAAQCAVSLRTIYRDVEALSALGIPIYSERGSTGGYRLLDGYRTRLTGLSQDEAEALFLTGLPGPAHDLGFGPAMAAAELKLLAALPADLRLEASRARGRFHLDVTGWFAAMEHPAALPRLSRAIREQCAIHMRYRSWKEERERRVEPLGLVLKSGAWYLVGRRDGAIRTYRVGRILELCILDEHFEPPERFDLACYWRDSTERLQAELHAEQATIRLSPAGVSLIGQIANPYMRARMIVDPTTDADGWRQAHLPIGSSHGACLELLRLGAEVEVLAPTALRAQMAATIAALARVYGS